MTAIPHRGLDPEITRRGLLAAGGAAVVGLALAELSHVSGVAGVLGSRDAGAPAYLRRSSFVPLVGDRFVLQSADRRAAVRLTGVNDLGVIAAAGAQAGLDDAFALAFHGSPGTRLDQNVMTLSHSGLGSFKLLVSPSGTGHHGQDYSAVINRATPPSRSDRAASTSRPDSAAPASRPDRAAPVSRPGRAGGTDGRTVPR
jgi:uncharacterized protein DUF6916